MQNIDYSWCAASVAHLAGGPLSFIRDEIDVGWLICAVLGAVLAYTVGRIQNTKRVHAAHIDELTGLPDRTIAGETVSKMCARHTPVTVVIVDVDGLKNINDTMGHDAGDQELIQISLTLMESLSHIDGAGMVSRLGGDEFLIITAAPEYEVAHVLEDVKSVSIGLASSPSDGDPWYAIACADIAMYHAKILGKGLLSYNPKMGCPGEGVGHDLPDTTRRRNGRDSR